MNVSRIVTLQKIHVLSRFVVSSHADLVLSAQVLRHPPASAHHSLMVVKGTSVLMITALQKGQTRLFSESAAVPMETFHSKVCGLFRVLERKEKIQMHKLLSVVGFFKCCFSIL